MQKILIFFLAVLTFGSCRVVKQGEVGVKRTLGKIKAQPLQAGARMYNPLVSKIITVPVRTVNLEVTLALPSKEGVNVGAEISILYNVDGRRATHLIETVGEDYENTVILPVFRASAADITAKFMAKDMHTGKRGEIEQAIRIEMMTILEDRGINIEAVLLKTIRLPSGLARAIEEKLEAEQDAQRMEFILLREQQDAQRRKIEAQGIMEANSIIAQGLTPGVIQFKSIEAFRELARSNNSKIIITDGRTPMLINQDDNQ